MQFYPTFCLLHCSPPPHKNDLDLHRNTALGYKCIAHANAEALTTKPGYFCEVYVLPSQCLRDCALDACSKQTFNICLVPLHRLPTSLRKTHHLEKH